MSRRLIPWASGPKTAYYQSERIPITALASAAASATNTVAIAGLTLVEERPLSRAFTRGTEQAWIWLPRRAHTLAPDGTVTLPRTMALSKGLIAAEPA
jgi:hypothetical protein